MTGPVAAVKSALSAAQRRALPDSAYVFPAKAPGSGSYPVPDVEHARKALQLSGGKPEHAQVKAAVYRRYPQLKPSDATKADAVAVEKAAPLAVDEAQHMVYGVVLNPGVTDSQGDVVSAPDIEKAAHRWLTAYRQHDVQHSELAKGADGEPICEVVESFIAPQDLEVAGQAVRKGAWVLGAQVNDHDTWQAVSEGRLTGFSIGGSGVREEVAEV